MATTDIIHVVGATVPNLPAAVFLGGATDDYIQINAAGAAHLAGAFTSGTFMAQVMPADRTQTGTIVTFGDDNAVEFVELNIEAGKLVARLTDGAAVAWVLTTDAEACPPHKWTHVALVQDGTRPVLYVNGVKVAQTLSTATAPTKWCSVMAGIDTGRIGAANKVGNASVTQEFGGGIADLKLYGGTTTVGALTATQVYEDYKFGTVITDNLINHYKFGDYLLTDAGTGADDGTAVGDLVLSDAYCEFESRFRTKGFVTADYPVISMANNHGHCIVVKSA